MKRQLKLLFAGLTCLIIGPGCVEADPTILATAHVLPECEVEGGSVTASLVEIDSEYVAAGQLLVNLAEVSAGNQLLAVNTEGDVPVPIFIGRPVFGVNFAGLNQLVSTTEYAEIGYDEELRVNQNQFLLQEIEFVVTDSPAPFELGTVPYTGLSGSGGVINSLQVPMLGPSDITEWTTIAQSVTGGDQNALIPVTVEAKMVGELVDGTAAESNVITLELLVCTNCGVSSTRICQ